MAVRHPKPLQTVVTYLEAGAPPRVHAPRPANIQTAIMRCEAMPLHFYRYLQYRIGRDYHWVYRLRLDDAALAAIIHAPETSLHVLYMEGAPAGFFELCRLDDARMELAYFGLMGHAHGRGLGRWFLLQALETAWSAGPERLTVNTCTLDHRAALPLYQKFGFQPVGQSETFITPLGDADHVRLAKLG
jgi:GNAT superfamily N-acetyltransferase